MGRVSFWKLIILAVAALPAHSGLAARDYYFFNKPGIDRQTYLEDRLRCDELAGGVTRRSMDMTVANNTIWQNPNLTTGQAAAASGIATFMMSFVAAAERRRLVRQIERICLADKGYRRIEMDKKAFQAIQKTTEDAARIDQWFALAAATEVTGKEMPE